MPILASPLRAGAALPLLWPTAPRSASSTWITTPWVRFKKTPLESHHPPPSQNLGPSVAMLTPTLGEGRWREVWELVEEPPVWGIR